MPELISISEFLEETRDDFHSPTTSTFVSRIPHCRNSVITMEEALESDREGLSKMKKSLKSIHSSGTVLVESELNLSRGLEKLGNGALGSEPELGAGLLKFAVVTKELSNLQKSLMQNLQNMLVYPLDSLLKGDIRQIKGELKRPFEKGLKDYEAKYSKLEKEKKAQSRDAGMFRKEVTPAEIADETERERRLLQLHLCDYLIKVNEIKTKKGVELLKHLVEYYHALDTYFHEGLKTMEHFGSYVSILSTNLNKIRQKQDEEKKRIVEMRNLLRSTPVLEKEVFGGSSSSGAAGALSNSLLNLSSTSTTQPQPSQPIYQLHQLQGNKSAGVSKSGYLNKKSEGKMRRVWQRRKCTIRGDGFLDIHHADESKQPTHVNLLTCQLKVLSEDRKFFDLVSYNRTYHLQSDDEAEEWISVILNSKESAMSKAFDQKVDNDGLLELTQAILGHVSRLPGNDQCADCGVEKDITWLSVNLGVLLCIECSGVHRTLGVGVSRIQSISLDRIPPSLLILSANIGNSMMNEVLEEGLKFGKKPTGNSSMDDRSTYIRSKYIDKSYVVECPDEDSLSRRVELAVESDDLQLLIRTWGQGARFDGPIRQNSPTGNTPLHSAILRGDLRLIDFLIHNGGDINYQNRNGQTPLHYCSTYNSSESAKLLLRAGADLSLVDNEKKTPLDIAKEKRLTHLEDLYHHSLEGKKTMFDSIDFDWNLGAEDSTDFSDDEQCGTVDETPEKRRRPNSFLVQESPFRSTGDLTMTPGSGTSSASTLRLKRAAPPPPSPSSNHTRSPSDSLIGRLGRLVIPPGPMPILRKIEKNGGGIGIGEGIAWRKCRALYDCEADNADEISFHQGDVITILNELTEDDNWMEGVVDGRRGMFPISFVEFL